MPFFDSTSEYWTSKVFEIKWLIKILNSYWHASSVIRWEYLQKLLRPVHKCLKEESPNFPFMTCLSTDSKLEGLNNVNATVGLLCKLDFVIHSVRSILKVTQKKKKNNNPKKKFVFDITLGIK